MPSDLEAYIDDKPLMPPTTGAWFIPIPKFDENEEMKTSTTHSSQKSECELVICSICLGVLQFTYFEDESKRYNGKRFC